MANNHYDFRRSELLQLLTGHLQLCECPEDDINQLMTEYSILQDDKQESVEFTRDELKQLADAFGISIFLLLPFAADVQLSKKLIVMKRDEINKEKDLEGATFGLPQERLGRAHDFAITVTFLDPKSNKHFSGDTHAHPGEEIFYVLDGAVEMRLHGSGQTVLLRKGSLLHFVSEQRHTISNNSKSEPASVLAIRFGQFATGGYRRETPTELNSRITAMPRRDFVGTNRGQKTSDKLISHMQRTWLETMRPIRDAELLIQSMKDHQRLKVADPVGLANVFNCFRKFSVDTAKLNTEQLSERMKNLGIDELKNKTAMRRLINAETAVRIETAIELARLFDTSPRFFVDYAIPTVHDLIGLSAEDFLAPDEFMPEQLAHRDSIAPTNIEYSWPLRRLAFSPVSISRIRFLGDEATARNNHPGFEIVIPESGTITISRGDDEVSLNPQDTLCVHFDSSNTHSIRKQSGDVAEALVIRFYEA